MLVQQASADMWIPNLINWFVFYIIAYILAFFGFFFVLIGQPTWFYDQAVALNLLPEEFTDYDKVFDS